MNTVLTSQKRIRVVALGCGATISVALIRPGSSAWNHKIELPYDEQEIDRMSNNFQGKYVSEEMALAILGGLPYRDDVVDLVITAKLKTDDEREGREHKFCWLLSNGNGDKASRATTCGTITLPPDETRQQHETRITKFVMSVCAEIKRRDTIVVFPGSFDPMHETHREVIRAVGEQKISAKPVHVELTTNHAHKESADEDEINERIVQCTEFLKEDDLTAVYIVSDHARFYDKYVWLNAEDPNKDYVFVMGDDIWSSYGDELKKDFGWVTDPDGHVVKKGAVNLQFLVFDRGEATAEPREDHPILHPFSWQHKFTEEMLSASSTQIRNRKKK